jgi:tripartite-type tricarboxylate transporter receptor subunit TctC
MRASKAIVLDAALDPFAPTRGLAHTALSGVRLKPIGGKIMIISAYQLWRGGVSLLTALSAAVLSAPAFAAWEPGRTVEFIVPAGTGGGADQMARFIQGMVAKHHLMKQPLVVVNKGGGAGADGFLDVKESKGNPHKLIITLSNLFTTPLATHTPFNWRDLTPVQMLALDEFVLWVNAETPYKTAKQYVEAAKKAGPGKFKMGGTGAKQEDQIITVSIEKLTGAKFTYLSYRGGGEVAVQLVGKHVDSTVNNPIEAVAMWRAGTLRPLCVFDGKRMPYKAKITKTMSWHDIPTCRESGLDIEYLMLRGIFMPGEVTQDQVDFYIDLFKKVRATPEWKTFMDTGAFNQSVMTGKDYEAWVAREEARHLLLMKDAGFIAGSQVR